MAVKIDKIDRRLIFELDDNSRIPLTELAKKLRIHRNVAQYRIRRLEREKVIRGYLTAIRPGALGYKAYKFYIKLNCLTKTREDEIIAFFNSLPLSCLYKTRGCWDYILGVYVRDIQELNKIRYDIHTQISEELTDLKISTTVEVFQQRKNYLIGKDRNQLKTPWIKSYQEYPLDSNDRKILLALAYDSRKNAVDISRKTGLSLKTIISRIRKLKKNDVIYDFRLGINLDALGISFYKCLIYLRNLGKGDVASIMTYSNSDLNVTYMLECIANWNLEIAYEVESEEQLEKKIDELKYRFGRIIKDIQVLRIEREFHLGGMPLIKP